MKQQHPHDENGNEQPNKKPRIDDDKESTISTTASRQESTDNDKKDSKKNKDDNNDDDNNNNNDLLRLAKDTLTNLKQRQPLRIPGVSFADHPLPPFLPKQHWTTVGNALKRAEQPQFDAIPGRYWVSLRCDGSCFNSMLGKWKRAGLLFPAHKGYSADYTQLMTTVCRQLMTQFNAKCGYTQSDELTILLAPTTIKSKTKEHHPHLYSGRVQKLCSMAASMATATFNQELQTLGLLRKVKYDKNNNHRDDRDKRSKKDTTNKMDSKNDKEQKGDNQETNDNDTNDNTPETDNSLASFSLDPNLLAHFDCRVGCYETEQEAMTLILWRAYDCGVNGVSDAVHHCKGQVKGGKAVTKLSLGDKLQWLHKHGKLPLPEHQRHGTYLYRRRVKMDAVNQKTGEPVTCLRSRIQQIEGNVLTLCAREEWQPKDEALEAKPEAKQEKS